MPNENIRSLAALPPSREVWTQLLQTLDVALLDGQPIDLDAVAAETRSWPLDVCVLDGEHMPWPFEAPPPLWKLARTVGLRDRRIKVADLTRFLESEWMDGVTGLDLSSNKLGPEGVDALVKSGRMRQLECLDLSHCALGDAGAALLVAALAGAGITTLRIRGNRIKSKGSAAFMRSPHLAGLTELDFAYNSFGAAGAKALAANPSASGLRRLDLEGAGVGDGGLKLLAGARVLRMLEYLNLSGCKLAEGAGEALQTANFGPGIRTLNLSNNADADVIGALTRGSFPRLSELDLTSIAYSSQDLASLGAAPWVPALSILTMDPPQQAGVSRLAAAHGLTGLTSLRLPSTVLTVDQCRRLLDARGLRRLVDLRVLSLGLGDLSLPGLAAIRGLHRLERLAPAFSETGDPNDLRRDLSEADLTGVTDFEFPHFGADAAAEGLAANPSSTDLERVTLSDTDATDAALHALAGSPHLSSLRVLEIAGADITDDGIAALAASANLSAVRHFAARGDSLGIASAQALASSQTLHCVECVRLEGPDLQFDAWDALSAGPERTWRAFLMTQSKGGDKGDLNPGLKGLLGYARHRSIQSGRLSRLALVQRIVQG